MMKMVPKLNMMMAMVFESVNVRLREDDNDTDERVVPSC